MVDLALLQSVSYIAGALGVCVAAIFYVLNLRISQTNMKHTLQTREAQLFNSLYQRFSTAEYCKQFITCMTLSWDNYEDFVKKYPDEGYEAQQFYSLCNWYKTMNLLVEQGYVEAYAMGRLIAFDFIGFWEKFKPIVEGMRLRFGDTALMDLDLLYASMKKVAGDIVVRHEGFTLGKLRSQ
jgi:hypothetical protein